MKIGWKADRLHPHNYPDTPTDYSHTDKHLRLIMGAVAHCCTRQSRAPNIDHCTPEIWPWHWPLTLTPTLTLKQGNSNVKHDSWPFGLDLWPTTLDLQSQPSQGQGRPSCQKSRSKAIWFKWERSETQAHGQTDRHYQFAKAMRSIMIKSSHPLVWGGTTEVAFDHLM